MEDEDDMPSVVRDAQAGANAIEPISSVGEVAKVFAVGCDVVGKARGDLR